VSINKLFLNAKQKVLWNGQEAAEVRGLTPDDFANILVVDGETLDGALQAFDSLDLAGVNPRDSNSVADAVMSQGPKVLVAVANKAPGIIARIIAVAADDNTPEAIEAIRTGFPLPLQFEILRQISIQTFAGPEGFRLFVGNVAALVGTVGAMTSAKSMTRTPSPQPEVDHSDDG